MPEKKHKADGSRKEEVDQVAQFKELIQMIQQIENRNRPRTPDEIEESELLGNPDYEKAKNQVFRFLSYRERSIKEVRDYLLERKGYNEEVTEAVVQRMIDLDYLNDRRFVSLWIKDRANSGRRGPNLLKKELQEKGISSELIENTVKLEFDMDREYEVACQLARKKVQTYLTKPEKAKAKLWRYLESKGFRYSTIKNVVSQVLDLRDVNLDE